jgi:hypothetical protein
MTPDAERIVKELRAQAAICRAAAAVPTNGGHSTDALLIEMARRLEREADQIKVPP